MKKLFYFILALVPFVSHSQTPERLNFSASAYYTYFSTDNPPALTIKLGQVIYTSSIDGQGIDKNGIQRYFGEDHNPLIGSFFVKGAEERDIFMEIVALSSADGFMGTWKQNIAKSTYSPGPAPKSATYTHTQDGEWISQKCEFINAEGKSISTTTRFKLDGKEYPYTSFSGAQKTITSNRINARTNEAIVKYGAETETVRDVLSIDGKTITRTITGTDTKGQQIRERQVYEKQDL